jgi:hypothetical protein
LQGLNDMIMGIEQQYNPHRCPPSPNLSPPSTHPYIPGDGRARCGRGWVQTVPSSKAHACSSLPRVVTLQRVTIHDPKRMSSLWFSLNPLKVTRMQLLTIARSMMTFLCNERPKVGWYITDLLLHFKSTSYTGTTRHLLTTTPTHLDPCVSISSAYSLHHAGIPMLGSYNPLFIWQHL